MKNESRPHYIWRSMRDRCLNPNTKSWARYGGRGITVCQRWEESFDNFWEDMKDGYEPHLQLDRKDNDKGYNKNNCRWVTPIENARNKSNHRYLQFGSEELTLSEVSEKLNISDDTILWRIKNGWPEHAILSEPGVFKRYTSRNKLVKTPDGRTLSVTDASKEYGISSSLLRYRIKNKYPHEQLFSQPRRAS